MPPPCKLLEFPEIVLLVIDADLPLTIPPPSPYSLVEFPGNTTIDNRQPTVVPDAAPTVRRVSGNAAADNCGPATIDEDPAAADPSGVLRDCAITERNRTRIIDSTPFTSSRVSRDGAVCNRCCTITGIFDATTSVYRRIFGDRAVVKRQRAAINNAAASTTTQVRGNGGVSNCQRRQVVDAAAIASSRVSGNGAARNCQRARQILAVRRQTGQNFRR